MTKGRPARLEAGEALSKFDHSGSVAQSLSLTAKTMESKSGLKKLNTNISHL